MPSIVFKDVAYEYVDSSEVYRALEGINLTVEDGEFVCLVGHSGCGKSTLLSLAAGLAMPIAGQVLVDGQPVTGPGLDRSIVFQSYSLFPWQTALKNVMFSVCQANKGMAKEEAKERALDLLRRVGSRIPLTAIPTSFRAACGSAWPLPVHWAWTPTSCCLTSRSAHWIQ